ncbi:hypothetical protein BCR33DRAFT_787086 [Rhizoclosmatium globosum]|uniref:Uncharacterized protein n=1 Tax=Rhizoclosmatium globosum TaxID=329046 RepID=A0A1Y2C2U9_9FUNG|nr:hypothetical protein BCR33DRAFT_787086 [Rhizoclosmatium globosum]|eukprot:ORY41360.1 hypothetical protein BCR33DRAFT_787086 [Rhizoclosmatium globosum]
MATKTPALNAIQKQVTEAAFEWHNIETRAIKSNGLPLSLTLVCFMDESAADGSASTVDFGTSIGLGLSASFADPNSVGVKPREILVGQVEWRKTNDDQSEVVWDMTKWKPEHWALFLNVLLGAAPALESASILSILISHKITRGRADFAKKLEDRFKRANPKHANVLFIPDGAAHRDEGLIFDVQVVKELVQFGVILEDRTAEPAMTFKVGMNGSVIVDSDARMYRTAREYIKERISTAQFSGSSEVPDEAVVQLKRATLELALEILDTMRSPTVNYNWEFISSQSKALSAQIMQEIWDKYTFNDSCYSLQCHKKAGHVDGSGQKTTDWQARHKFLCIKK